MVKFSVLIPTRNRLNFLKYAIASVLRQNYPNVEIIISDNASEDDTESYVRSLNEPCIKYSRSEKFLTVTENWNRCIDQIQGDYVIMLGDDDILLKHYFTIASRLIEHYKQPDLIYTNAFFYAYPNVIPEFPQGVFNSFGSLQAMPKHDTPFFLDLPSRIKIVQRVLNFETAYGTNMQHALIHKSLIDKVKKDGRFFYSPYPDLYAMNAMFIISERTLIYPKELVVIGVTPKSHGYYFYNNKEKEGTSFLNIEKELKSISTIQNILLPAPGSMLSFWLGATETLKNHFSLEKYGLSLDYTLYRKHQINYVLTNFLMKKEGFDIALKNLKKSLTFSEKFFILWPQTRFSSALSFIKKGRRYFLGHRKKATVSVDSSQKLEPIASPVSGALENKFLNALEIFEQVEPVDCKEK